MMHTKELAEISFGQRPSLATDAELTVPDSDATAAVIKRLVSFPLRLLPRQPLADPAPMIFGSMKISKNLI